MANPDHLEILKQGAKKWNVWREKNPNIRPDLSQATLQKRELKGVNFDEANLRDTHLEGADLRRAQFQKANCREADFRDADLRAADFLEATCYRAVFWRANLQQTYFGKTDLKKARFGQSDLRAADLWHADCREAHLGGANLTGANLHKADIGEAHLAETVLSNVNLQSVKGLNLCKFDGPFIVDYRTLVRSGNLPLPFLRGCGLPDTFINYIPSLLQTSPIQFYSCFISHSTMDYLFAERLFNDLQGKGVRTWYAPEEMKGGEKLYDQIDSAIRLHDKLLLVLSEHSLKSEWVLTEIRRCRKAEKREGKRKLFPIRLVDMETIQDWECFDADSGKDLAVEVREFFLPDFSTWKDHDSYKKAFDRLLRDLQESAE